MRAMESNFRGVRSASGTRMENSASSADTRSVSENESSMPDSNSDSSGAGSTGLAATRRTISRILLGWILSGVILLGSIPFLFGFRSRLLVDVILIHQVLKQRGGQAMVSGVGEVNAVHLRQARC